jgi:hypothetical protein
MPAPIVPDYAITMLVNGAHRSLFCAGKIDNGSTFTSSYFFGPM